MKIPRTVSREERDDKAPLTSSTTSGQRRAWTTQRTRRTRRMLALTATATTTTRTSDTDDSDNNDDKEEEEETLLVLPRDSEMNDGAW